MAHRIMRPYGYMPDVRTEHDETPLAENWWHESLRNAERALSGLTQLIQDKSHRVDEYQAVSLTGDPNSLGVVLSPDYETPEIIEYVVATGPVTTACTINLGRRSWTMNTSAQGLILIGPMALSMDRDDVRQLTSAVAGNWTLELMGYADIRYRVK